eukprot:COSAG01_NODE_435_length_17065_cov_46.870977_4_plen_67_part_00
MPHGEDGGAARAYGVLCRLLERLDWEPLLGLRAEVFIVAEPEPAGAPAEGAPEEGARGDATALPPA